MGQLIFMVTLHLFSPNLLLLILLQQCIQHAALHTNVFMFTAIALITSHSGILTSTFVWKLKFEGDHSLFICYVVSSVLCVLYVPDSTVEFTTVILHTLTL